MRRLLTARDVAEQLGVSPETMLRWHRDGKVPGIRLPSGAIRFHPAAIEEWLSAHGTGATSGNGPSTQARPLTRVGGVSDQEES
jgi:excisionase family DNA binding protein